MMKYAEVIVDLSSQQVDRLFTYAYDENLALLPGMQVLVPFGPRRVEGFVISLAETTDLPPEKIKRVIGKVWDYPIILPEMVALAQWIKTRYHCNLVDALRLMLPAEMRGGRVREKTVRAAALIVPEAQARAACARAPKQMQIVEMLLNGPKPVPVLAGMAEGAGAAVTALQKKGIVAISQDEVYRRPAVLDGAGEGKDPPLMRAQQAAVEEVTAALRGGGGRFLLHGVTGSGKTEVYIRVIRQALKEKRTAIVLVPEIALTPQMVGWFHERFGGDAAVLHSRLSAGERFDEWRRIRSGDARVVIGARSAVFAPLENVGIIIVDEEHEHTYQSDKRPRYDAREIAWQRMERAGGVLLLGSATPAISSYMRAMPGVKRENRLTLIEMNERVLGRRLPEVEIVDMRRELELGNHSIFSARLIEDLTACMASGKQAILFINRRGHSTFVSCRACGHVEKCGDCDVSLTYHQADNMMHCHYCGKVLPPPVKCPECGSSFIKYFGAGTQKVEEELKRLFPDVPIARMDVDTTQGKDAHARILGAFRAQKTRILVGTQMIAKGLDFPEVTLVGVVAADTMLNLPDYRSVERTFQLITQVAGRAGRADSPGHVIVQTYEPENYGIQLAARQDFRAFYMRETQFRRQGLYPPFTVLARLLVTAREAQAAETCARAIEEKFNAFLDADGYRRDVIQMRALEAPIARLRGEARWQVFIKMYAKGAVDAVTAYMEQIAQEEHPGARVELEVNPVNMI